MEYFSPVLLKMYLKSGMPLKVYVDKEYYDIPDETAFLDDGIIAGVDDVGDTTEFNFKEIEQISIGDEVFDLKSFNDLYDSLMKKSMGLEDKPAKDSKKEPDKETDKNDDKKKKESIIQVGSSVINENSKSSFYKTKGIVEIIEDGVIYYRALHNKKYTLICADADNLKLAG